jgi:hypothetical protein
MSLRRLWQRRGKGHAAHTMLADLYTWFTERGETVNLQEAQALLDVHAHYR